MQSAYRWSVLNLKSKACTLQTNIPNRTRRCAIGEEASPRSVFCVFLQKLFTNATIFLCIGTALYTHWCCKLLFLLYFYCDKIHIAKFTIFTIFSLQFKGTKYLPTVLQLPPPSVSGVPVKYWLLLPTIRLSVSMTLAALGTSGKWIHTVSGLLGLADVTEHRVLKLHPRCGRWQRALPFQGWLIFRCLKILHFAYPLLFWSALGWLPPFND